MSQTAQPIYEFDDFRLEAGKRLLWRAGEVVPLTSKCFETLLALVESRGETVEKDALLSRVWPDTVVEEKNLTINISTLRKALGESPQEHRYIVTVPGRGYRFVAEAREIMEGETELIVQQSKVRVVVEEEEQGEGVKGWRGEGVTGATRALTPSPVHPFIRARRVWLAVALLVVLVSGLAYWWRDSRNDKSAIRNPPSAIKSLAVLPFKSLNPQSSPGSNDDYLGVGLADVTITRLSSLNQLIVRPTSSVLRFAAQDPLQAGQSLKVDAVLDGSLQQVGDRVRVSVRLLRVSDGAPLWAEKFDEPFTDILAVEDAISARVASALTHSLTGEQRRQLAKHYTENTEAWQLYLKGRYFWNKRTDEAIRKATVYFRQAIGKDPQYALAHAGLAASYDLLGDFPSGKAAAAKALEIDDALAEAHESLAVIIVHSEWDFSGSDREFKRAIELDPNSAFIHQRYGHLLAIMGQFDKSIAEERRALELDPLSVGIKTYAGITFYFARQYDRAIEQYQSALEMGQNFASAHYWLGQAYQQKGMYGEAIEEFQKARQLGDATSTVAALGRCYAVSGETGEARKILEELKEASNRSHISAASLALIYTGLGDKDQAFQWLQRAYVERDPWLIYLKVDPNYDHLRSDPRFSDLLRRVGLEP
jgi:DNA-binding winged helix-turn-helix (wHTH) protein/TolB-like protein/TolA-binding protein